MMKYVKIVLMYYSIILAMGILSAIVSRGWFNVVGICVASLAMLAAFFHIGKVIPSNVVKKKYYTYIGTILCEILLFLLLSIILDVSLRDTLLALIAANVVFMTLFIIVLDIGRYIKNTKPNVAIVLYIVFFVGLVIVVGNLLLNIL